MSFWSVDTYKEGTNPPSFDKQFVRDWLEQSGWNKQPPAPKVPKEVIEKQWLNIKRLWIY